jgi:ferredoxin
MLGKGCEKPLETCLIFGVAVDYYERNGLGRVIDKQEALDILKEADEAGLVLEPSNAREIVNICCCCGCCCQLLRNFKRYPKPASLVSSPFMVVATPETCEGCGVCVERCQMDAVQMHDDRAVLETDRCIGCGLCVSTCPTGSLTLVRKPHPPHPGVPKDMTEAFIRVARERGKLGPVSLVRMQLKSKLDRLLASK